MLNRLLAVAALLLACAAPALAQDDCGTQADPCPWVVDLEADGFAGAPTLEATQGDWVAFDFQNLDEVDHTVALDGYDLEWTVPAAAGAASDPIELTEAGEFTLADAPSGDRLTVRVFVTDPADQSPILDPDATPTDGGRDGGHGDGDDEEDSPGLALPLTLLALVALVLLRRRA